MKIEASKGKQVDAAMEKEEAEAVVGEIHASGVDSVSVIDLCLPSSENEVGRGNGKKDCRVEMTQAFAAADGVDSEAVVYLCSSSNDASRGMEALGKLVEIRRPPVAADGFSSSAVIDPYLSPSEDEALVMNTSFCNGTAEIGLADSFIGMAMEMGSMKDEDVYCEKEEKQGDLWNGIGTTHVNKMKNGVFRRLLRAPRYFDPPRRTYTCSICGEDGHAARRCKMRKRMRKRWNRKPCALCGNFGHAWKRCARARFCYACKEIGHLAKHCPEEHKDGKSDLDMCLHCGDSGHHMFSCSSDYVPDDLKEIKCYVCKKVGHLCCLDVPDISPIQLSCYNCGQRGHLGSSCEETSISLASEAQCLRDTNMNDALDPQCLLETNMNDSLGAQCLLEPNLNDPSCDNGLLQTS